MRALALACLGLCACAASPPRGAAAEAPGATPAHLFEQGRGLAQRGDLLKAEQYMALAVRAGYPAARALPSLVRVCLRASRLRAALLHAEPVLSAHPRSRELRYLVATLHLGLGQQALARHHLGVLAHAAQPHRRARALLTALGAETLIQPLAPTTSDDSFPPAPPSDPSTQHPEDTR